MRSLLALVVRALALGSGPARPLLVKLHGPRLLESLRRDDAAPGAADHDQPAPGPPGAKPASTADADDVVQETWLAALRHHGSLRAFIAGVRR